MRLLIVSCLLLAACDRAAAPTAPNRSDPEASAAASSTPGNAKAIAIEEKTELYEFVFSWPAEASAMPRLALRLKREMEQAKSEVAKGAEEDKAWRDRDGLEFQPHSSSTGVETAGHSDRLLSLRVDAGGYTGGAHGNSGTDGLLWDRRADREVKFADLFADRRNRDRLLTQSWCDALNRAREEKRGVPVGGNGMFDECPSLNDIAIIPSDKNRDGRFDELVLVASPYIAGPYAEGDYEITLPVTAALVATLDAQFRPSFAAQDAQ